MIPLTVHGAFHSGLMRTAQEKLSEAIHAAPFKESSIKVIMNASAAFPSTIGELKSWLISQVTHPVRWQESMERLDKERVGLFIEVGCGKTLSQLNKRIGVSAPTLTFEKLEDLERLAKELA